MTVVILIIAFIFAGVTGYCFGPRFVELMTLIPTIASTPFDESKIFYVLEVVQYGMPLILAIIFLITNFFKKLYKGRVNQAIGIVMIFFTLYSVSIIYAYVEAIIFAGAFFFDEYSFVLVGMMILMDILSMINGFAKKDVFGAIIGALYAGFFAYHLIHFNDYSSLEIYFHIGQGFLLIVYSVLCFINSKKLKAEEEKAEEKKQEKSEGIIEEPKEGEDLEPEMPQEIQHPVGYVEEPKEGEVLGDNEFKEEN